MSTPEKSSTGELSPRDVEQADEAAAEGRRQREHTAMQIRELRSVMDAGVASYARRLFIMLALFIGGLVAGLAALYLRRRG